MAEINKGPKDPQTGEELVRTVKLTVEVPLQNLVAACKAIQKHGRVLENQQGAEEEKAAMGCHDQRPQANRNSARNLVAAQLVTCGALSFLLAAQQRPDCQPAS